MYPVYDLCSKYSAPFMVYVVRNFQFLAYAVCNVLWLQFILYIITLFMGYTGRGAHSKVVFRV